MSTLKSDIEKSVLLQGLKGSLFTSMMVLIHSRRKYISYYFTECSKNVTDRIRVDLSGKCQCSMENKIIVAGSSFYDSLLICCHVLRPHCFRKLVSVFYIL